MARIGQPTSEQEAAWAEWVESRPESVKAVAKRFDPWSLYLLKTTGQRVTILAIAEDGTVRVNVSGNYNFLIFERQVFGINPDDLEPCELPSDDELTGSLMTPEQVDDNIEELRCMIRPDLFFMGEDGKAKRKN